MTEPRSILGERDPDLVNAEIALKRAARLVREEARRSGTALAYVKDGELTMERPTAEPEEDSPKGAGQ